MFETGDKIQLKEEFRDRFKIPETVTFKCYDKGSLLIEESKERFPLTYFEPVPEKKKSTKEKEE